MTHRKSIPYDTFLSDSKFPRTYPCPGCGSPVSFFWSSHEIAEDFVFMGGCDSCHLLHLLDVTDRQHIWIEGFTDQASMLKRAAKIQQAELKRRASELPSESDSEKRKHGESREGTLKSWFNRLFQR